MYIANVGANEKHKSKYNFIGPILEDGTFEFIPINEKSHIKGDHILKYCDIKCYNSNDSITKFFSKDRIDELSKFTVHYDPEFETYTYGDGINKKNIRSINLCNIEKGDYLFFITNLYKFREGYYLDKSNGFYFIGYFEVEKIYKTEDDIKVNSHLIKNNAHYRQWLDGQVNIEEFLIIKGSQNSKRFKYPFKVDREFCDKYLRTSKGEKFDWKNLKTEIKAIGTYTRTIRAHLDKNNELWNSFWKEINEFLNEK